MSQSLGGSYIFHNGLRQDLITDRGYFNSLLDSLIAGELNFTNPRWCPPLPTFPVGR